MLQLSDQTCLFIVYILKSFSKIIYIFYIDFQIFGLIKFFFNFLQLIRFLLSLIQKTILYTIIIEIIETLKLIF